MSLSLRDWHRLSSGKLWLQRLAIRPPRRPRESKAWTLPRLADGHPDLQGVWTNATLTPLERAPQFGNEPFVGFVEEAAKADEEAQAKGSIRGRPPSDKTRNRIAITPTIACSSIAARITRVSTGRFGHRWWSIRRTGMFRVHCRWWPRRPSWWCRSQMPAAAAEEGAARGVGIGRFDSVKDRPLGERCLLGFGSTSGPPMMPVLYNNSYQIVQTKETIMVLVEMVHDVRVIRMDGSQHLPKNMTKWLGDSVGHWEGDTLVADTANFTEQDALSRVRLRICMWSNASSGSTNTRSTINCGGRSERVFQAVDRREYPFLSTKDSIYDRACPRRQRYAMPDILGGARKDDAAAATRDSLKLIPIFWIARLGSNSGRVRRCSTCW